MGNSPSKNEPLPKSSSSTTTISANSNTDANGDNTDLDSDDIAPALSHPTAINKTKDLKNTQNDYVNNDYSQYKHSKRSEHAVSPAIEISQSYGSGGRRKGSFAKTGNTPTNHAGRYRVSPEANNFDVEIGISMAKLLKNQQDVSSSSLDSSEASFLSPVFTTLGNDLKDSDSLSSLNSSSPTANNGGKNLPGMEHQDGIFGKLDSIAESQSLETSPEPRKLSTENLKKHDKTVREVTKTKTTASLSSVSSSPPLIPTSKKTGVDIDSIIERLLATKKRSPSRKAKDKLVVDTNEIKYILGKSRQIFLEQPSLLRLSPPVKIVGDIHGQFHDLVRIFNCCGYPPHSNYLFLGDYVDRGEKSLETILLLLCYKIKYPENFFMLRGNHESANITKIYGFYDECKRRLSVSKLWRNFVDVFNVLPIAATINDKIFCVHGGLSPELDNFKQVEDIKRPTDVPDKGLLTDLLWSDPDASVKNLSLTNWPKNDRGVSYCFGKKHVDYFCSKFKLDLIVRGHMVVEDGYEFFNKRKLVTIFSAPNYCGEFNNFGAIMSVDKSLFCSFELIKPS
ncbi:hypothetical protein KGF56_004156 [Candida oxycetoniae]|uniref:Serine/threonine-protein phosphatase n=1 Tax=Candida oxycetoniae TaxID=497107 RepID=A0AAI9WWE9_9ASCO|nr:uncharacterized protein KGF56_004156 [Candida oxycetoniae]KAI3403096.2 hypothetical protein KGF56_004156 [Candida oxycetoniae]